MQMGAGLLMDQDGGEQQQRHPLTGGVSPWRLLPRRRADRLSLGYRLID